MARDELTPERSAWWDRKLDNWALWRKGAASVGSSASDGTFGGDDTRPPQPLIGEAFDVDRLVQQLPHDEQRAIEAVYVWSVGNLEERAAALGIHRNTLRNRVDAGKRGLDRMWWEKLGRRAPEPVR